MTNRGPILSVASLVAAMLAQPAASQTAPNMVATRDVAVSYRSIGGDAPPGTLRMSWLAAARQLRTDVPGIGWSVADHRAGTGFMVVEEERRILPLPPQVVSRQLGPSPAATFTREGNDRVAGQGCTIWRYQEGADQGRICLTADGVMLRSQGTTGGISGGVEAVTVTYAPQDPAQFQPPEGYQRVQPRQPRTR
ncbi:hypothetical protein ACQW02_08260 [Humitalea sp. 24SJ18S-53]|uniref:hypothetical protein n=1 Tax=Humitalea sp. 24SJ18S-53 TaxID=3422307 RepID=UPI003D6651BF